MQQGGDEEGQVHYVQAAVGVKRMQGTVASGVTRAMRALGTGLNVHLTNPVNRVSSILN